MVLEHSRQGRLVTDVADPARQLRVPAQGVAADQLVVGLRPVDEVVGVGEVEAPAARLCRVPLYRKEGNPFC